MTNKKWNLQDIQPANRPRRAPRRMERMETARRAPETTPEPELAEDEEDVVEPEIETGEVAHDPADENQEAEEVAIRRPQRGIREPRAVAPMHRRPPRNQNQPRRPHPRTEESEEDGSFDTIEIIDGNSNKRKMTVLAAVVFVIIVLAGFIVSNFMAGADVTVTPRFTEKNVSATFTGSLEPKDNAITYSIIELEASGERQVKASGQEDVTMQAEGTILIYNEYGREDIRLKKNTRFASADGLIYKIKESAVVPGYSTDADGKMIPGVVTADVFAESPGDEYNRGPGKFTIPGFEGYPEYEKVYGETTAGISGGFSGKKFIIDEAELEEARQALHTELRNSLLEQLPSKKLAGYVVYDSAVTFTFESQPSVAYGTDLATIKETGYLRVPQFKESEFANFLAAQSVPDYKGLPVRLEDYSALTFSYTSATTTISDISELQELQFNLSGGIKIIWEFDEDALKASLLGVSKSNEGVDPILKKYPGIETASATVRPFWKTTLPREMKDINIIEVVE